MNRMMNFIVNIENMLSFYYRYIYFFYIKKKIKQINIENYEINC